MKISIGSWIYGIVYGSRWYEPKAVSVLQFVKDVVSGILDKLLIALICAFFAYRPVGKKETTPGLCAPISWWPRLFGQRVWPISLMVPGLMIWPFVDLPNGMSLLWAPIAISYIIFLDWIAERVGKSGVWKKISEERRIVFTENGRA